MITELLSSNPAQISLGAESVFYVAIESINMWSFTAGVGGSGFVWIVIMLARASQLMLAVVLYVLMHYIAAENTHSAPGNN